MKNTYITVMFLSLMMICHLSCDTDNTLTCLKTDGKMITEEYELASFDSIIVYERVQLIVKDAPVVSVILETGENLLEDFEVFVTNNTLIIKNNASCNLVRDYDTSILRVSHPSIRQVRNSSGRTVMGDGLISWESLRLVSDDLVEEDFFHKSGDFDMELDAQDVLLQSNGLSNFFIRGAVTNLDINLLEGDSRLPLNDLAVQNVTIFHRGTNDVLIAPQLSITGELRSTGNLILTSNPPVVDVTAFFTGRVIFE